MLKRDYTIYADCRLCRSKLKLEVNKADYDNWKSGTLIQNAFPYLTPDQREILISHTCGKCWDKMFG